MRRRFWHLTGLGWIVALTVGGLCLFGLVCLYGIETGAGEYPRYTMKQLVSMLVCIPVALLVLRVGYLRIAQYSYPIAAVAVACLLPLIVAKVTNNSFGGLIPNRRGSYRWIQLPGYQFQPSEFMKIGYILALGRYLKYRQNYRRFMGLLAPFVLTLIPLGLVLLQPDLGTALLTMPVLFIMLFAAGARVRHLAVIVLLGAMAIPFFWTQLHSYQRARVTSFFMQSETLRRHIAENPERYEFTGVNRQIALTWERNTGWQLVCSKAALGSGGWWGEGWGEGAYVEYSFLPDRHNDFIFAVVGHQFGFVGCAFVLLAYAVIVVAGITIAMNTDEAEGRLLAVGVVALLSAQVIINVGMTIGLMPVTGMTLPFVSYGGSSLLINFVAVALLISVSQHRPFLLSPKPFEFDGA